MGNADRGRARSTTDFARGTKAIRVTEWAHLKLHNFRNLLQAEIDANPENWPGRAGRLLTLSDCIVLLCERYQQ